MYCECYMLECLPLGTNDREKSLLVEEYQRRVVCHGEGAGSERDLAFSPSPLQLWRMDVASDTSLAMMTARRSEGCPLAGLARVGISKIFTRIECRKNEGQDWKRKGKTKTTNRRKGEIPSREVHLYPLRRRRGRRKKKREERIASNQNQLSRRIGKALV